MPTSRIRSTVEAHRLGAFFLLAVSLSWAYWIPLALFSPSTSHFPGLMGPALAGLIVTGMASGRRGLAGLLRSAFRWRVAPRWYLAALAPLLAGLIAGAVLGAIGFDRPTWRDVSTMPGLGTSSWWSTFLLVLLVNGYGEEVGWRGAAWPALRTMRPIPSAAGILVVPWAVWHVPTFWLDTGMAGFDPWLAPGWLVGLAAGAVVLGWLVERSGSLLIAAVFHAFLNMASAVPAASGFPQIAVTGVVIAWAVLILRSTRDVRP